MRFFEVSDGPVVMALSVGDFVDLQIAQISERARLIVSVEQSRDDFLDGLGLRRVSGQSILSCSWHERMIDRVLNPLRSDELRFQVLRLLEQKPDMAQRGLAAVLNISVGRINYCVQA